MSEQNPTGTATATGPMTVHDAADAFEALLTPQEDNQEADEGRPEAEAKATGETPEAEAADPAGEEETDEPAEGEEESPDPEAEGDEEQEEQTPTEPTFTVRVDGTEVQVSQSELIAGYSRTSDYTRKTQKLAEERKALTAEAEATSAERAEYAKLLPKLRAALEQGLGEEPNWAELRASDPQAYLLKRAEWDERREKIERVRNQERLTEQRQAAERAKQLEQIAIEQHNLLLEKLPSWRDPKVAEREAGMIEAALVAVGFSGEELKIFDHRAVEIARKAALYDEIVAQRKGVKEKLKGQKVPVVKPGAPATRKSAFQEAHKANRNRLARTGNVNDAAKILESLLPD